jgi:hypothetical protein
MKRAIYVTIEHEATDHQVKCFAGMVRGVANRFAGFRAVARVFDEDLIRHRTASISLNGHEEAFIDLMIWMLSRDAKRLISFTLASAEPEY